MTDPGAYGMPLRLRVLDIVKTMAPAPEARKSVSELVERYKEHYPDGNGPELAFRFRFYATIRSLENAGLIKTQVELTKRKTPIKFCHAG